MKVAIVHDWLVTYAGAEKVLEQILLLYPDADLFSVVDFFPEDKRDQVLLGKRAKTSFIQGLPFAKTKYRHYLPFMPVAVEQFDLSSYDLIISSSYAVAKGVLTGPDQIHLSYVHSPIRYAWDMQHQYLRESGLTTGLKGWAAKILLHYVRQWDYRTANGVNTFAANSHFIARRIRKVYQRDASVIYPPVDVSEFDIGMTKEDFFLTASRMVPYKRIDLIVEAFSRMPDKKLVVIGDGPDFEKIKAKAAKNITLLGYQPTPVLRDYMQRAKAFVFAAEEDFGITPVEAQACGTPVIAFGKGGVLESIRGLNDGKPTGVFFPEQTPESLINAVDLFHLNIDRFSAINCRQNAGRFSVERFRAEFKEFVDTSLLFSQANQMSKDTSFEEFSFPIMPEHSLGSSNG